jgi:hypothetical protein
LQAPANSPVQSSSLRLHKDIELTSSIVICTRNRPVPLRKCLEAISHLEPAPDELIVVDNSAGDKQTESAALQFSARYLVEPLRGLSRARNRGLAESNSEIVVFVDDDAVPTATWLGHLVEPFTDPSVAVVTGETIDEGSVGSRIEEEPARTLSNKDAKWFEIATFGGLGIGANMALRKSACKGWKVFDERLGRGAPFRGGEEQYAFARLISLGYSAVHIPAALVVHPSEIRISIEQSASYAIAYWWLLFFDFPGHRLQLVQFLFRRLRHKPLSWPRSSPDLGPIITSGWRVRIKAGLAGTLLYLRARKSKGE